jgi:hypothetical protein
MVSGHEICFDFIWFRGCITVRGTARQGGVIGRRWHSLYVQTLPFGSYVEQHCRWKMGSKQMALRMFLLRPNLLGKEPGLR